VGPNARLRPSTFGRALADADPRLGECVAVTYWTGGNEVLERLALERAGAVIGYGGRDAIASLRARAPVGIPFLGYGHRVSFGVLAREALTAAAGGRLAADAALAVATFDQQGCVSPHVVYVEEGGRTRPRLFAGDLAHALQRINDDLPRGRLSTVEAASVQQLRTTAEFRALAGEDVQLWAGDALAWTVVFDADPAFTTSCLNRAILVKSLPRLEDIDQLVRNYMPFLQSVALAAPRARAAHLAESLALAGCTRITSLENMPFPPPSWHHDGRGPLRELVRWADWEPTPK